MHAGFEFMIVPFGLLSDGIVGLHKYHVMMNMNESRVGITCENG